MRLKKVFPAVFVLTVALHISLAVAMDGNPERGKNLATGCVCHRGDLDGMSAEKLAGRLMDFKSGRKKHETMNKVAGKLTEQQIVDLASWFSSR